MTTYNYPNADEKSSRRGAFLFPSNDFEIQLETARKTWEKPLAAIDRSHNDWHALRRKKVNAPKTTRLRTKLTAAMLGFATSQAALDHLSKIQTYKPTVYISIAAVGAINLAHAQLKSIGGWSARKNLVEANHKKVHNVLSGLRETRGEADFLSSGFVLMLNEALAPLINPNLRSDTEQRASELVDQFEGFLNYSRDIPEDAFADATRGFDFITKSLHTTLQAIRYDCDEIAMLDSPTKRQSEFQSRAKDMLPALQKVYGLACKQRNLFENAARKSIAIERIPICRGLPNI